MTVRGPSVAICVVTHEAAPDLPACFRAVSRQSYRPLELVVVDCASVDDSARIARDLPTPGIDKRVVASDENLGFSGGMNRALRETRADWILSLNADTVPAPDFVERLVLRGEADPRTGAVTGRLLRPQQGGERRIDAGGMVLTRNWRHLDRGSGEVDRGQWQQAEEVFGATGAASLFRRAALDDVAHEGGETFDEACFAYREDAELAFRLQEREWRVVYEPTAICEHRRRVVPERRGQLPARWHHRSGITPNVLHVPGLFHKNMEQTRNMIALTQSARRQLWCKTHGMFQVCSAKARRTSDLQEGRFFWGSFSPRRSAGCPRMRHFLSIEINPLH